MLPVIKEKAQLLNTHMSRRKQKSGLWISTRPEVRNDCAGEDQQQFRSTTEAS
jgi:hypothetical protein